jgi:hypothetical protein
METNLKTMISEEIHLPLHASLSATVVSVPQLAVSQPLFTFYELFLRLRCLAAKNYDCTQL